MADRGRDREKATHRGWMDTEKMRRIDSLTKRISRLSFGLWRAHKFPPLLRPEKCVQHARIFMQQNSAQCRPLGHPCDKSRLSLLYRITKQ